MLEEKIKKNKQQKRRQQQLRQFLKFLWIFLCIAGIILAIAYGIMGIPKEEKEAPAFAEAQITPTPSPAPTVTPRPTLTPVPLQTEVYPESLREALARNPEIETFAQNYADAQPVAAGGISETEKNQNFPLFLQWDERWGYVPYGDDNIGLSGCAPTCLSMVLFSLTRNEAATPDSLAAYATEKGYYVYGTGTAWAFLSDFPTQYPVSVFQMEPEISSMTSLLDQGYMFICSMGPGDFTDKGHFIVIYGHNGENFLVNDPFSRANSGREWDFETLHAQIKNLWVYSLA